MNEKQFISDISEAISHLNSLVSEGAKEGYKVEMFLHQYREMGKTPYELILLQTIYKDLMRTS